MRLIYLIIGFLSLALAIIGVVLPFIADNAFSFVCLLLVSQEVPSASKIGFIIPNSIKHMWLIFVRPSPLRVNVRKKSSYLSTS